VFKKIRFSMRAASQACAGLARAEVEHSAHLYDSCEDTPLQKLLPSFRPSIRLCAPHTHARYIPKARKQAGKQEHCQGPRGFDVSDR
jgi:hypothetical protein